MTEKDVPGDIMEVAIPKATVMRTLQSHREKHCLRELHDTMDAQYKICEGISDNGSLDLTAKIDEDNLVKLYGNGEEIILERGHTISVYSLKYVTNYFVASCQIGTKVDDFMYDELKSGRAVRLRLGESGIAQIVN